MANPKQPLVPSRIALSLQYWRAEVLRAENDRARATTTEDYEKAEYELSVARATVQRLEMEAWNI